jgi:hypothetical protein
MIPTWLKLLIAGIVVLLIAVFVNRLGDVSVPEFDRVRVTPENLTLLSAKQGWPRGWAPSQAEWFHHASQGTRILPYNWFINLEQPTVYPSGKLVEGGYLERFGFLPSEPHGTHDEHGRPTGMNPDGLLPIGFAIEKHFDAPYANPPSSGPVVGLTCAACHTGRITYKVGNVTKGILIEGGSAMINLAEFQEALGRALWLTVNFSTRFDRFARGVLGEKPKPGEKEQLKKDLAWFLNVGLESKEYARAHKLTGTVGGFGRTDALGLIGNRVFVALGNENLIVPDAPVNFPPLWDTAWFDWVQYNASIRMPMVRNIGEALGVGAPVNLDERKGPLFASTVNVRNLHLMEDQLGGRAELTGLRSPKWNETGLAELYPLDRAWVDRGATLYTKYCQHCHLPPMHELEADVRRPEPKYKEVWITDPRSKKRILRLTKCDLREIGTDPNQAMNLYRRVAVFREKTVPARDGLYAVTEFIRRDKYRSLQPGGLSCAEAELYDRFRIVPEVTDDDILHGKGIDAVLVANPQYKARPLDGIWATPPFLHNGSVPNLYQMLLPVAKRDRTFYLGSTVYDPVHAGFETGEFPGGFLLDTSLPGNSNDGHEFRNLTLDELESLAGPPPGPPSTTPGPSRDRWERVLPVPVGTLTTLSEREVWTKVREATELALQDERVQRDHPFKGVIGPELTEEERLDLVEYLKSL